MTRRQHPTAAVLAAYLHRVANLIGDQGDAAIGRAHLLAARGWPTSTTGDGSRSADTTSSTERAALNPGPWTGIDDNMATALRLLWYAGTSAESTIVRVLSHASDDDPIPAGTGECLRCGQFCRPTADNPDNRLKAGLCAYKKGATDCYKEWMRAGKPERSTFNRTGDAA